MYTWYSVIIFGNSVHFPRPWNTCIHIPHHAYFVYYTDFLYAHVMYVFQIIAYISLDRGAHAFTFHIMHFVCTIQIVYVHMLCKISGNSVHFPRPQDTCIHMSPHHEYVWTHIASFTCGLHGERLRAGWSTFEVSVDGALEYTLMKIVQSYLFWTISLPVVFFFEGGIVLYHQRSLKLVLLPHVNLLCMPNFQTSIQFNSNLFTTNII